MIKATTLIMRKRRVERRRGEDDGEGEVVREGDGPGCERGTGTAVRGKERGDGSERKREEEEEGGRRRG